MLYSLQFRNYLVYISRLLSAYAFAADLSAVWHIWFQNRLLIMLADPNRTSPRRPGEVIWVLPVMAVLIWQEMKTCCCAFRPRLSMDNFCCCHPLVRACGITWPGDGITWPDDGITWPGDGCRFWMRSERSYARPCAHHDWLLDECSSRSTSLLLGDRMHELCDINSSWRICMALVIVAHLKSCEGSKLACTSRNLLIVTTGSNRCVDSMSVHCGILRAMKRQAKLRLRRSEFKILLCVCVSSQFNCVHVLIIPVFILFFTATCKGCLN